MSIQNPSKKIIIPIILVLVVLALTTQYYGSNDIGDYSGTARFFSGNYAAKIRNSHSYFLGFIHAPFLNLTNSFLAFKISSLIFLILTVLSVYYMTKSKKAMLLMLISPVIWYLSPWINPVQAAGLFFLGGYYYIDKFDKSEKLKHLALSGIFLGLAWVFWDTILFFAIFLAFSFLYNKKLSHFFIFLFFIFIGLLPRLILDTYLFNFPLFSIMKSTFGTFTNAPTMRGTSYEATGLITNFLIFLSVFITIPIYFWQSYRKTHRIENKKTLIFLSLSVLLILVYNPQIRYTIIFIPIMTILMSKYITEVQYRRQIIFSIAIILLFIFPYIIQIFYSIDSMNAEADITYLLKKRFNIALADKFYNDKISQDLSEIAGEYPGEVFLVGNKPDDYAIIAIAYWKSDVKELVSIQDYNLVMENKSVIIQKTFSPQPKIAERRQIFITGGISKNQQDNTDYDSIEYAIGLGEPVTQEGFSLIKSYNVLFLSKKNA
jgi:hypothetical protein